MYLRLRVVNLLQKRSFHYNGWYYPPATDSKSYKKDTTALVLGWAGSQPRYVQAYTKFYANELGIGAHGFTLPMEYTFNYDQDRQREIAQICLDVISKETTGKKLIIHCFSNNGFVMYKHVSQLLKQNPNSFELVGGVFDSCPGPLSILPYYDPSAKCPWLKIGAKIMKHLNIKNAQHDIPVFYPFLMQPATYGYFQFTEAKRSIPVAIMKCFGILPMSFWNYFKYDKAYEWAGPYLKNREQEQWPMLFLYSKKDSLMPFLYVSDLIETKKKQNTSRIILSRMFEKSAHVAHMRKYPDEYKEEIKKFLDQCVSSENKF